MRPGLLPALADGDEMLVGFSRGAYQVRALAGMIHEVGTHNIRHTDHVLIVLHLRQVGLAKEGTEERIAQSVSYPHRYFPQVPYSTNRAYHHYLSIGLNNPGTINVARKFKKMFCWPDVRIHFIGVW